MAPASRPTEGQIPFDFSGTEATTPTPQQPGINQHQSTAPQPGTAEFAAARQAEIDEQQASGGVYSYGRYDN